MIPYLYTMNHRAYSEDLPLIMPMYYDYPEETGAYKVKNQYMFGSELLAAPITEKRVPGLNAAKVKVWLPKGIWYDIYTGMMYDGDRMIDMYRDLNSIPVLAGAGAILPFTDEIDGACAVKNPDSLRLKVYAGANGSFELYEDDNETCAYENNVCVKTKFEYSEENDKAVFLINGSEGTLSLIPEKRSYNIELTGFKMASDHQIEVTIAGHPAHACTSYDAKKQAVMVSVSETAVTETIKISINLALRAYENKMTEYSFDFLNQAEIPFFLKDQIYNLIQNEHRIPVLLAELKAMELDEHLSGALTEIITAKNS